MKNSTITLLSALLVAPMGTFAGSMMSEAPANAEVYFVQPSDGASVQQNVKVVFGLRNMGVAPAGVDKNNTGHHHLLIDTDVPSDLSKPLPATDNIKHFGGGQTETEIELAPGTHTLQLLLGDHAHVPHSKPVVSDKITIKVE
ncbi:DUF4399 domain-containing protein [Marinobacter sp. SBS5]|uniref:DUF4399 domain-containing protein n=1 Tax=Marinobacter sp. SBS5 TaxID=3401754 RepID=UPI003AAAD593